MPSAAAATDSRSAANPDALMASPRTISSPDSSHAARAIPMDAVVRYTLAASDRAAAC